jgi:hypothetical protein
MRRAACVLVVLLARSDVYVLGQSLPNFSGQWVSIEAVATPSSPVTIEQTANEIRLLNFSRVSPSTYRLDGVETEHKTFGRYTTATTKWVGSQLVINEVTGPTATETTLSLDQTGRLTISVTRVRLAKGLRIVDGPNRTTIYRKAG